MTESKFLSGWRLTVIRILSLFLVIGITVYIFLLGDEAEKLKSYSYPGIFVLSILANATIILPAPGIAITFAMGAVFNPIGVALAAGAGATIGELTGYLAGFSGQGIIEDNQTYQRLEGWTKKHGGIAIFLLALIPNPLFDFAGVAAGALGMPVYKFLLWVLAGKILKMLAFSLAGAGSIQWLDQIF
ncbi:MAG: VTT domain-containing protein [Anaerolineales bacterium]|nr:VTT domain-containing protein [Anaerolineales bacterium]